jgi:hypothetical protein
VAADVNQVRASRAEGSGNLHGVLRLRMLCGLFECVENVRHQVGTLGAGR